MKKNAVIKFKEKNYLKNLIWKKNIHILALPINYITH